MRITDKRKIALVLSGGGIKAAAFHLGVCLALREKGFAFAGGTKDEVKAQHPNHKHVIKLYVGSSAGAVICTFLASGLTVESIIDAFERGASSDMYKFIRRPPSTNRLKPITYLDLFALNGVNFMNMLPNVLRRRSIVRGGLEAFIKGGFKINGLFTTRGIERYLRKYALKSNRFSDLGVELFIVATQLNHSRKVVFGDFPETTKVKTIKYASFGTISEAVAASAALPPVYAPIGIKNQKGKELFFFDGEIRDTLSTHVAADHGADLVISSYSIQPYHFNKEIGSLHTFGIPAIINQALYQVIQQKIEKHIERQQQVESVLEAVSGYFNQQGLPAEHRDRILEIITKRTNHKPGVDYLYIHPSPTDYEMFFTDHFSLNPTILGKIVHIGFKSGIQILRKLDL